MIGIRKCVSCQFPRVMRNSSDLYYCDQDKIEGRDYGHPVKLGYRACKHYEPLVNEDEDFGEGVRVEKWDNRYYAIDGAGNVISSANYKDIATAKAYKHIRDTFLLQSKQLQLDLFT
jgi:hypothetical protein